MKTLSTALVLLIVLGAASIETTAQTKVTVKFRPGTSSGTYTGTVRGRRYIDYTMYANGGQTLSVTLTRRSGEPPYFNVLPGGSEVAIADDAREATEWTGTLSDSGTYVVRVYIAKAGRLANRTSNYRITFKIE